MFIDFITFCHKGDMHRLYAPNWIQDMVTSHDTHFDTVYIVRQKLGDIEIPHVEIPNCNAVNFIRSEDHPNILTEFGLPENDPVADKWTHAPDGPHVWWKHVINHLIGLKVSDADYIVFSDSDCFIRSHDPDYNWIRKGIEILQKYPKVLIVGPGDGATMAEAFTEEGYRLTQNVSQQLFVCERERLLNIDFNIDWGGEFRAPGGPFAEYYWLLEGRIWRYMDKHDLWRCILPDYVARYWHCGRLTDDDLFEKDFSKY